MTTSIERLQNWYIQQCDGDWEHQHGIKIGTLDNPGWEINIDLIGTSLEGGSFESAKIERAEHDWIHSSCKDNVVKIYCGPQKLDEALLLFCDWADAQRLLKSKS